MVGALIGGLVAAGSAAADASQRKKAATAGRPKRRRLAKFQEAVGQAVSNKQRALIAMAQAHQNFASQW